MKAHYKIAIAMAGSFALGAAAVQGLHAQAKPPAYSIAEINVKDQDGYAKEFLPLAVKTLQEFGAKYLVRGGKTISFQGEAPPNRVVVLQFESLDKAQAWWNSKATKDAFAIGEKYATFKDFAVEGVSP
jgi:uncharacterized protein (DUF1330 family)